MKDKKAFTVYILLSLVLWQFAISMAKIISDPYFKIGENDLFSVVKTMNNGAAFGLLEDNPYILGTLGIVVLFLVCFYVFKNIEFKDKTKLLYTSIFTAGILGNTYERFTNGFVTDFIKIDFFNFPVFNLFDILICVSVFMYIIFYIKEELIKRIK